jgi:hypothetical protein
MSKRIFVCYASQDEACFNLFIQQSKKENITYELAYTEDKDPLSETWKSDCLNKINDSQGIVVLISPNIKISEDAFWEMKCSKEQKKPIIGVFVGDAGIRDKPIDLTGVFSMVMAWDRLTEFVNKI